LSVKLNLPAAVGIPLIVPVAGSSVIPVGRDPFVSENWKPPPPESALTDWKNPIPTIALATPRESAKTSGHGVGVVAGVGVGVGVGVPETGLGDGVGVGSTVGVGVGPGIGVCVGVGVAVALQSGTIALPEAMTTLFWRTIHV